MQTRETTKAPSAVPAAMAIIEHHVASWGDWRAAFDGYADARAAAGVRSARISRSVDVENAVTVCLTSGSFEALEAFLSSPERRQVMQRAGVVGVPTTTLAVPVEDVSVRDRPLAGAFVRHRVADFGAWKRGFDARATVRAKAGVVGHAIARAKDDPSDVIVFLQAESVESLRRFTSAPEMRQAMAAQGVRGEPRVSFVAADPVGR